MTMKDKIKTINEESLVGEGNIAVSGSGGKPIKEFWQRHENPGTGSDSTRVFFNGSWVNFQYNLDNGKLNSTLPFPGFNSVAWFNNNTPIQWNDYVSLTLTLSGSGNTGEYDGKIDIYNTADDGNIPNIYYNWVDERIAVVIKDSQGGFNTYGYGTYTPW